MSPIHISQKIIHLRKRSEFLAANSGKKAVSRSVIVQHVPQANTVLSNEASSIRLGLTATRKLGGAVIRNRVKRKLRAAFTAAFRDANPGLAAGDYVLIGRPETYATAYADIHRDLLYCLRKLKQASAR